MNTKSFVEKGTEFSRDLELELNNADVPFLKKTVDFMKEEVKETDIAINDYHKANLNEQKINALDEIVDGFGDVAFIALNGIYKTFLMEGFTHDEATNAVTEVMHNICDANLGKKQADGSVLYKEGKVQKPEGWKPPYHGNLFAKKEVLEDA